MKHRSLLASIAGLVCYLLVFASGCAFAFDRIALSIVLFVLGGAAECVSYSLTLDVLYARWKTASEESR